MTPATSGPRTACEDCGVELSRVCWPCFIKRTGIEQEAADAEASGALREALERLVTEIEHQAWGGNRPNLDTAMAQARVALASPAKTPPEPEGLDVDRLVRALEAVVADDPAHDWHPRREQAYDIAREYQRLGAYARLTATQPEREEEGT